MSEESEASNPSRGVDISGGNNSFDVPNEVITIVKHLALLYTSGKDKEVYIIDDMVIPSVTDSKYRK